MQCTAWILLDDLDYANHLVLQSYTHQQMQMKTISVSLVGLDITNGRSINLKYNTENTNSITFDAEALEVMESFMYLDSIINERGRSDADMQARTVREKTAFKKTVNQYQS
ncbi:unnamed protein product [Schistosoma curassoni]|uniref:Uncharacterized protein n=1 Tax=Schistosoma curassoni TaxID=6186 RepID=A0A183K2D0_9TREM|nr:unnamed protein product [Schistosoma curassoni]